MESAESSSSGGRNCMDAQQGSKCSGAWASTHSHPAGSSQHQGPPRLGRPLPALRTTHRKEEGFGRVDAQPQSECVAQPAATRRPG